MSKIIDGIEIIKSIDELSRRVNIHQNNISYSKNLNIYNLHLESMSYDYDIQFTIGSLIRSGLKKVFELVEYNEEVYNINVMQHEIKEKNSYVTGLYKLIKQHKEIYESGDVIYDCFVEQAGTYGEVLENYKKIKTEYEKRAILPINELESIKESYIKKTDKIINEYKININSEICFAGKSVIKIIL